MEDDADLVGVDGHTPLHKSLDSKGARPCAPPFPDAERTPCEIWTRVMGYHRPTSSFNPGKQSEHRERRFFVEPNTQGL